MEEYKKDYEEKYRFEDKLAGMKEAAVVNDINLEKERRIQAELEKQRKEIIT